MHACAGPWKHLRNGREWKERRGRQGWHDEARSRAQRGHAGGLEYQAHALLRATREGIRLARRDAIQAGNAREKVNEHAWGLLSPNTTTHTLGLLSSAASAAGGETSVASVELVMLLLLLLRVVCNALTVVLCCGWWMMMMMMTMSVRREVKKRACEDRTLHHHTQAPALQPHPMRGHAVGLSVKALEQKRKPKQPQADRPGWRRGRKKKVCGPGRVWALGIVSVAKRAATPNRSLCFLFPALDR